MKGKTIAVIAVGCGIVALLGLLLVVGAGALLWLLYSKSAEPMRMPEPPHAVEMAPFGQEHQPATGTAGEAQTSPDASASGPNAPGSGAPGSPPPAPPQPAARIAPPPASAAAVDTANWVQHANPLGFAVQHPRGWTVETTGDGMIVVRSADRACVAVVMPFFARGTAAQECLTQAPHFLAPVLAQARVTKTVQKSRAPDVVLASLAYDAGGREGHAALLATVFDRSGMLFVIGAPADQYAAGQPVLLRVLQTFRFTKPTGTAPAGGADASVRYIPWQDPNEQAFTVEVPEGWKVTGGLIRRNAVDPRGCLQIASPDGDVVISSGDATVPTFTLPGFSEFFPEGSDYSPGYGVAMKVMRYKSGTQFAAEYVQTRVGQTINDIAVTGSRDRADIAQAINEISARYSISGVQTQLTMGEVTFTGRYQGKAVEGYWFAGTQLTTVTSGGFQNGLWTVPNLIGYVATREKAPLAQAVMAHMVNSTNINPQWVAMQQGLTANVSKIVTETNNAISSIITKTYEGRQAAQDNISRKWSNMMLGQTDLVDPDTGQTYKAASGHNYYWVRPGSNTGAGTNTYDPPDINLVPLVEW